MFTQGMPLVQWLMKQPRLNGSLLHLSMLHDGYLHGQVHLGMPHMDSALLQRMITVSTVMLSCSISISICIRISFNKMVVFCVYLLNCVKLSDYA